MIFELSELKAFVSRGREVARAVLNKGFKIHEIWSSGELQTKGLAPEAVCISDPDLKFLNDDKVVDLIGDNEEKVSRLCRGARVNEELRFNLALALQATSSS